MARLHPVPVLLLGIGLLLATATPTAADVQVDTVRHTFSALGDVTVHADATVSGTDATDHRQAADTNGDGNVSDAEADTYRTEITADWEEQVELVVSSTFDGGPPTTQQVTDVTLTNFTGAADTSAPFNVAVQVSATYAVDENATNHTYHVSLGDDGRNIHHVVEAPPGYAVVNVTGLTGATPGPAVTSVEGTAADGVNVTFAPAANDTGDDNLTDGGGGNETGNGVPGLPALVVGLTAVAAALGRRRR